MSRRKRLTINRLEFSNFKRFYGTVRLELTTDPDAGRSIVLVGAENGRGKTSIQEAIHHVLYGEKSYPGIRGRDHYLKTVSDRLNRRALDEGQTDFHVAMELTVEGAESAHTYRLERRWEVDTRSRRALDYTLSIAEDNIPIKATSADDSIAALYDDFVWGLVPPQVSPFFFFDGEKIQQYAEKGFFGEEMAEAIQNILDIKVYQTLRDDLKKNVIDFIARTEINSDANDDLFELRQEANRLSSEIERKRLRLKELAEEVEEIQRKKQFASEELVTLASPHQSERESLVAEQQRLEADESEANRNVERAMDELPLLLPKSLAEQLRQRLDAEGRLVTTPERIEEMRQRIAAIEDRVVQAITAPETSPTDGMQLSTQHVDVIRSIIHVSAYDVFELHDAPARQRLHDVSDGQRLSILDRLEEVKRSRFLLTEAIDRRERASVDRRRVEAKLSSTTDDPYVVELLAKQTELSRQLGQREQEEKTLRGELAKLESDHAKRNGQIEHREQQRRGKTIAVQTVQFADTIRDALQEFIHRLSMQKLKAVEQRFLEMYSTLRKAEDPWSSVEVDPATYEVFLKDSQGRRLERSVFSAGMKEMYALSLLWALGQTSGRQLPIVIDTPMGRLDRRNREALFEKYLPRAAHQVIVLSTDTEVDVEWARRLEPHVAKQYHLDWDSTTDGTVIKPGYFF
jgi:DNA sulfur modification protein DndD